VEHRKSWLRSAAFQGSRAETSAAVSEDSGRGLCWGAEGAEGARGGTDGNRGEPRGRVEGVSL